jgi:predicted nucleic acid-binding Zn ribbon protein
MERCVLCGKGFPSRAEFDRHDCRVLARPARRRPSRWAIEVMFLTFGLGGICIGVRDAGGASPVLVGFLFALYTLSTAVSIWGLFRIHSDDIPDWPRHTMPRWEYAVFYESRVGRIGLALLLLVLWGSLLIVWLERGQ